MSYQPLGELCAQSRSRTERWATETGGQSDIEINRTNGNGTKTQGIALKQKVGHDLKLLFIVPQLQMPQFLPKFIDKKIVRAFTAVFLKTP